MVMRGKIAISSSSSVYRKLDTSTHLPFTPSDWQKQRLMILTCVTPPLYICILTATRYSRKYTIIPCLILYILVPSSLALPTYCTLFVQLLSLPTLHTSITFYLLCICLQQCHIRVCLGGARGYMSPLGNPEN